MTSCAAGLTEGALMKALLLYITVPALVFMAGALYESALKKNFDPEQQCGYKYNEHLCK